MTDADSGLRLSKKVGSKVLTDRIFCRETMINSSPLLGRFRPEYRLSKVQRRALGKGGTGSRYQDSAGKSGVSHASHQRW